MKDIRQEAYRIILKVLKSNLFSDKLLQQLSKDLHDTQNSDFLYKLVKGVIKMKVNLDYIASLYTDSKKFKNTNLQIKTILYMALYQLIYMDSIPEHAAVNESVELAKKIFNDKVADFINAVLRAYLRNPKIEYPSEITQRLSVEYSFPKEIIVDWLQEYGEEETEMLCMYFNDVPNLTIRVNELATSKKKIVSYFAKKGVEFNECDGSSVILTTKNVKNVLNDVAMEEGYYSIQDASAAMVVELMAPEEGQSILDLFAAPGGKATFIAEKLKNTGEVIANDKIPNKIKLLKQAVNRLKINNLRPITGDAFKYGPVAPAFDNVLLDVPCSGWGVFQRKAELRWQSNQDVPKLIKIQEAALQLGAKFVKPGGCIVYSTCTLNKKENEEQVQKFLNKNTNFELVAASDYLPSKYVTNGFYKTIPHIHQTDGAFAAKLRKLT